MSEAASLPGREPEHAQVGRFLTELITDWQASAAAASEQTRPVAPGRPRVLVFEGERGIGKSALLDQAAQCATASGCVVLRAQCVEAEVEWGFVVLADLLSTLSGQAVDELNERELAAVLPALTAGGIAHERDAHTERTVADATLRLLSSRARTQPIVIVVDDLHWIDSSSATVLRHILRRGQGTQIALIASEPTSASGHFSGFSTDGWTRVRLGGLSLGALAEVLTSRLKVTLPRRIAVQLLEASGGNPAYALELARASLSESQPAGTQGSLISLVTGKIARLPERTRGILLTAALADDPSADLVCAAIESPDTAWADLDVAEREGLARWVDGRVVFTHDIVRSSVAAHVPAAERRAAHRRLATVVTDPEQRARHRALAADGHDEDVATALDAAVESAAARGDRHRAAELAELAVAQTPPHSPNTLPRLIIAARSLGASLDLEKARLMLGRVVAELPAGPVRAMALGYLGATARALGEPNGVWTAILDQAVVEAEDVPGVLAPLQIQLAMSAISAREMTIADAHVDLAQQLVGALDDDGLTAQVHAARALLALMRGEDTGPDLERALALGACSGPPELRPHITAVSVLRHRDELDAARAHADAAYRHVLSRGVDAELPLLLWNLIELEVWSGHWDRAAVLVERGWETARWARSPLFHMLQQLSAATLHAHVGELALAHDEATEAHEIATRCGYALFASRSAAVLGFIELTRDRHEEVDTILGGLTAHAAAHTMGEPGLWRALPDQVEALVRLGRIDEARELLVPYRARALEIARSSAIAAAARAQALIDVAQGVDPSAALADALDRFETLGMPFERGRCLLVAAEVSRRLRRRGQARDYALQAITVFTDLGARAWQVRAEQELTRVGGRTTSDDGLSVVERQIAQRVAEGLSNREIAATSFMAVRTVEAHLTAIYRKLGVRSRTQLAAALDGSPETLVGA